MAKRKKRTARINEDDRAYAFDAEDHLAQEGMTSEQVSSLLAPYRPEQKGVVPAGRGIPKPAQDSAESMRSGLPGFGLLGQIFQEGIGFPGYGYLSSLILRAEYRNICDTIASKALRKWGKIISRDNDSSDEKNERIQKIEARMHELRCRDVLRQMLVHDMCFGQGKAAIILKNTADDELSKPLFLDAAKVGKKSLIGFRNIEPWWMTPSAYESENPLDEWFYRPKTWWMMGREIHSSRLLNITMRPVPDLFKPAFNFGGMPLTLMAKPYVTNWLRARQSVSDMLYAYSVVVLKTDLTTLMSAEGRRNLRQRVKEFAALRNNMGVQICGQDEEVDILASPLTGLNDLQTAALEQICAVSKIPVVEYTSNQPSGLNASSDSELECWRDTLTAIRENDCGPTLQSMISVIQLDLDGEIDADLIWRWDDLNEVSETEANKMFVEKSRALSQLVEDEILRPSEARDDLRQDPSSPFSRIGLKDEEDDALDEQAQEEPPKRNDRPVEGEEGEGA